MMFSPVGRWNVKPLWLNRLCCVPAIFLATAPYLSNSNPGHATLDPAARQIEMFYGVLLDSMKQGQELGIAGRYRKLQPAIEASFDLAGMMKIAVGPSWSALSAADQRALVAAFERMTVANYAHNFDSFDGQKFVVHPDVGVRNEDRIVQSELQISAQNPVIFIYRMHLADGAWKIVDIYLNGSVSELALRRSEFLSTIEKEGAAALAVKLNHIADGLMAGR